MTARAGVAGRPIGHSLSPLIHGLWVEALGLEVRYEAFEPPDETAFSALVDRVRSGALNGLNVTAPYKEAALNLAEQASETARACGSANLLWLEDGQLKADSTDGRGLMAALAEQAPDLDLTGRTVTVLGAGGAARAAIHALGQLATEVHILNRTRERAVAVIAAVQPHVSARLTVANTQPEAFKGSVLVINAVSGPVEVDLTGLESDAVVMDMTYRPLETDFLEAGRANGHRGVDGLAMLIGQARPSFRTLFGVEPPDIDVRAAALERLKVER